MSGYEWICVTEQAAFAGRDGAGALVFQGQNVAAGRLESP